MPYIKTWRAPMEKIYDKCCGIDVHKKLIVACLRSGRKNEIREFGTSTKEILSMTDWLTRGQHPICISRAVTASLSTASANW